MLIVLLLLKKIINLEVHLQDRLVAAFVVQSDDECSRSWGCYVEINIRPPIETKLKQRNLETSGIHTYYQGHCFQQ